jgi:hypothetical protein
MVVYSSETPGVFGEITVAFGGVPDQIPGSEPLDDI